MFKKELGGKVRLFKGRGLLLSEKKVVGCTKNSQGERARFILSREDYFTMKEKKDLGGVFKIEYWDLQVK